MKKINLSDRLQIIAQLVTPGTGVADVGTDHGYIPIYLAQNNYPGKIFASDINQGPLNSAKKFAIEYEVENKIEFFLSDGLKYSNGENISTVIIAGMGGENIANILENAPWMHNDVQLILQPQTMIDFLANWLDNNKYAINDAVLVKDAGKIYTVFTASSGKSRSPFTCGEMFADRILLKKKDPLLHEYLTKLITKFEKKLLGMEKSSHFKIDELYRSRYALDDFKKMLEETEKW